MEMEQLFGIQGIHVLLILSILPCFKVQAQELPEHHSQGAENVKYPNGISETGHSPDHKNPIFITPDLAPDPTFQTGPGVVIGPGVLIRGKPSENPLLKNVLPPQPFKVDHQ